MVGNSGSVCNGSDRCPGFRQRHSQSQNATPRPTPRAQRWGGTRNLLGGAGSRNHRHDFIRIGLLSQP